MSYPIAVRVFVCALLATLAGCAATSSPTPDPACLAQLDQSIPKYEAGGVVTAPRVVHRVEPAASIDIARGRPRAASVEAVIGEDGMVRAACLASGDPRWGQALMDAVRQWRFEPATLDSRPVAVRFVITSTIK